MSAELDDEEPEPRTAGALAGLPGAGVFIRVAARRRSSFGVRAAAERIDRQALDGHLAALGRDGPIARHLDEEVDQRMARVVSLSGLTSPLALGYLERLARPIPDLTLEVGVQVVTRAYVAHLVVEGGPHAFGAKDVPVLGTLPPLRRGRPPQDLTTRVVKATRRNFEAIRALSAPVWDGFVWILTRRSHDRALPGDSRTGLVSVEVVDGLARVGWVLRQVDLRYGQGPELRG
ncbi:MAG: hypothetical protein ACRDYY_05665 [Acidimicrobiales bacterium]